MVLANYRVYHPFAISHKKFGTNISTCKNCFNMMLFMLLVLCVKLSKSYNFVIRYELGKCIEAYTWVIYLVYFYILGDLGLYLGYLNYLYLNAKSETNTWVMYFILFYTHRVRKLYQGLYL